MTNNSGSGKQAEPSYEDDFYSWTVTQGAIIRERRFDEIDVENVAEEIESWGQHFKHKLADLVGLLQTCLLLCWADKATVFTMHTRDILRIAAKQTCDVCWQPGRWRPAAYIRTLCDAHAHGYK
jgi:hypothetical protein